MGASAFWAAWDVHLSLRRVRLPCFVLCCVFLGGGQTLLEMGGTVAGLFYDPDRAYVDGPDPSQWDDEDDGWEEEEEEPDDGGLASA